MHNPHPFCTSGHQNHDVAEGMVFLLIYSEGTSHGAACERGKLAKYVSHHFAPAKQTYIILKTALFRGRLTYIKNRKIVSEDMNIEKQIIDQRINKIIQSNAYLIPLPR